MNSDQAVCRNPVEHVAVLGGGTAGLLCAIALKKQIPALKVTVIRSSKLGVIGVGEGTIPSVLHFLHGFLGIPLGEFHRRVEPSMKLGIRFEWGPRPYFNYSFSHQFTRPHSWFSLPKGYYVEDDGFEYADVNAALMSHDRVCVRGADGGPQQTPAMAYHLENRCFVGFLEEYADGCGIAKIDAVVEEVRHDPEVRAVQVLRLDNDQSVGADLFVDCSGFGSLLLGKTLGEPFVDFKDALYCDHAIAGGWERGEEDVYHPYTTAETMNAGWAWRIEHDRVVNRGYVFSSDFIDQEKAMDEFARKNPRVENPRVLKFQTGVHRNTWVGNVVAIGNAAGFVEPLEATAIGMICDASLQLVRALQASDCRPTELQRTIYNRIAFKNWTMIRDFLALHYRFNHRLETEFWNTCCREVPLGDIEDLVTYYQEFGPDLSLLTTDLKRDFFGIEGYVALLVGQSVSYRREVKLAAGEKEKWELFQKQLSTVARSGIPMAEFLEVARNPAAGNLVAPVRPDQHAGAGELNWG